MTEPVSQLIRSLWVTKHLVLKNRAHISCLASEAKRRWKQFYSTRRHYRYVLYKEQTGRLLTCI